MSSLNAAASPSPLSEDEQNHTPAVSVRKSLASKDHLISLIDGKPYRTLTRHLGKHGLTPDTYRQRYGLKPDYPMVSDSYSQARREMAVKIGLGRKPVTGVAPAPATPKRGRKSVAEAKKTAKAHLGG